MDSYVDAWQPSLWALLLTAFISPQAALAQECAYEGGWALRNDRSCPPSAPVECGTGAQPRCCPSGFKCTGDGDYVGNYCCSDPSDCRRLALEYPKCPDSTWSLWGVSGKLDNGGWCCQSGQNGTYRDDGSGIALLCTPTTATSLPQNHSWAEPVNTASCPTSSTTVVEASTAATTTTTGTAAATTTADPAPEESTDAAQPAATESDSMSTGAIAGAAVGGVAGGALLIAGIFFLWRRKRKSAATSPEPTPTTTTEERPSVWDYNKQNAKFGQGYNEQSRYNELAAQAPRAEMDSTAPPTFELDATTTTTHELDSTAGVRPIQRDDAKFR